MNFEWPERLISACNKKRENKERERERKKEIYLFYKYLK